MDAAETLKTTHRRATYRTLIGLLASTGMRIGEAIALDLGDFDPGLGVVVVHGKLSKLRELPLTPSTTEAVSAHVERRDRPPGRVATPALFVGIWGTRLEPSCVASTFCLLRARAGIEPEFGSQPTMHGLRHTFAIRAMLDAYQQGHDAAVPELMRAAADRLEQHERT